MTEKKNDFLSLFYPSNEKVQSGKIQNNIYLLNFPTRCFLVNFLVGKIKKEQGFQLILYIIHYIPSFIHTLISTLSPFLEFQKRCCCNLQY